MAVWRASGGTGPAAARERLPGTRVLWKAGDPQREKRLLQPPREPGGLASWGERGGGQERQAGDPRCAGVNRRCSPFQVLVHEDFGISHTAALKAQPSMAN